MNTYARLWLVIGSMLIADHAQAQCSFDTSTPSEGDVLAQAPASMTINFLLGIHLQTVRLVDGAGAEWPLDWTATDHDVFRAEFRATEPLPPGKYQIEWTAYVRQHYHPDGGVIPFTIGTSDVTPAATPPAVFAPRAATGWPYRALPGGAAPPRDR